MMSHYAVKDGTGASIHFEVRPGCVEENIFFIHGNLASNRWWQPAESVWRSRSEGSQLKGSLIYAEFRGCGKSSPPRASSEVDMRTFARDFIALIKDEGLAPVHLVGHSTGGLIAGLMLSMEPSLFKRAVLLDPVGAMGVKFDSGMIAAFDAMKTDRALTATVIGSTIRGNNPESEFFQTVIVDDAFAAVKSVGHLVLQALDGLDARAEMKRVQAPVLVLHGEHDQLLSVDDSRAYTDLIPGSTFALLPDCGHCANIERPELFVSQVEEFLFRT